MASTTRSKWLPKLAKAIGWTSGKLRSFYKKRNYKVPFDDERKGMKLLAEAGIPFSKYKPTENGIDFNPKAKIEEPKSGAPEATDVTVWKPPEPAKQSKWDLRLPARLAKLTRYGNTTQGRNWVRYTLKARGYTDDKYEDEAQALAIFRRMNIPTEAFEYEHAPGTPGGPLFAPPASTAEELREQYMDLTERVLKLMDELQEKTAEAGRYRRKILLVRDIMLQAEAQTKIAWNEGTIPGIIKPLSYASDALNEIRSLRDLN